MWDKTDSAGGAGQEPMLLMRELDRQLDPEVLAHDDLDRVSQSQCSGSIGSRGVGRLLCQTRCGVIASGAATSRSAYPLLAT